VGDVPANPSATRWDGSPEVEGIPGRRKESPTGTVNEGGGAVSIAESSLTPVSMRCEIWGNSEVSHRARAVVGDGEQRGCLEPSGRRAWSDGLRSGGSSDASSAGNEQETLTFPSTETRGRARRRAQWPCEALDSLSLSSLMGERDAPWSWILARARGATCNDRWATALGIGLAEEETR
jgi:hypothetical protein